MTTNVVTDEQLGILARRQNDLFRRVREGTLPVKRVLGGLQSLIEGAFDAIPAGPNRLIDCDIAPYIPNGWSVESHTKGGQIEFDPSKITTYFSERQKNGKTIVGHDFRKELEGKPVLNACVLDHLLANTDLIPDSWKKNEKGETLYHFFWGTLYRDSDGYLYVRYLCWSVAGWDWGYCWLDLKFGGQDPAAVLAS